MGEETWHPVLGCVGHVQDLMKEWEESKSTAWVGIVVRKRTHAHTHTHTQTRQEVGPSNNEGVGFPCKSPGQGISMYGHGSRTGMAEIEIIPCFRGHARHIDPSSLRYVAAPAAAAAAAGPGEVGG
jgi:hypothetical protein